MEPDIERWRKEIGEKRNEENWERSTTRLYIVTLFNFYAEYIMRNARLDESQARIKIAGRNNNLRYADDTILKIESEEEIRSHLIEVKEKIENAGLKFNFQKKKIMVSGPITSWQ